MYVKVGETRTRVANKEKKKKGSTLCFCKKNNNKIIK